ncbi:MAG TPA: peptide deformylase [Solirubrobacteraceae bacterium]|nr:peptide deformylase [Solirubrobacteraceae bacterium]
MSDDAPQVEVQDEVAPEDDGFDEEFRARRAAALAHVRKWGDPVLKARARAIDRFDETLHAEVDYMRRVMQDAYGVGLAAPQVGTSNRVLVYRVQPESPIVALVNPELEWVGRETETIEEGCLSLPNVHVDVERPVHVRARALDEHGETMVIEASGLEARVLQHEIDHLDGVLMIERCPRDQRKAAIRTLREQFADRAA